MEKEFPKIDVNTTCKQGTHFLKGVELVEAARAFYVVPSENWPYPTEYRLGMPGDKYYAEIWVDGMDWQLSYWLIETSLFENPKIYPLIIFDADEDREKYNDCDFRELLMSVMWYRRDLLWIKNDPYGVYNDTVWPYITRTFAPVYDGAPINMDSYRIEHASQKSISFYLNSFLLPDRIVHPTFVYYEVKKFIEVIQKFPYIIDNFYFYNNEEKKEDKLQQCFKKINSQILVFQNLKYGIKWETGKEDFEEFTGKELSCEFLKNFLSSMNKGKKTE